MVREMKDSGIEWIGNIPTSWQTNTVFQLFTQVKNKNTDLQEQNLLSLSYGKIKRRDIDTTNGLLPESFDGYNIIEAGDIVLRLTDLQNDHKSLRVGLATERGIVTSAYLTIRNRSKSLAKYLYYYLHSFDIAKGFYGMGAGVRQGLNWDGIKWLKVLSPSVQEQHYIVSFLDVECSRIDAVINQTRASIEEYKKLKQAVITQAVTKGIRPDRKMKDSGVKWIGEIPLDWQVLSLGTVTESMRNGYVGPTKDIFFDEGVRYIQSLHIKDGKIDFSRHEYYVSEEWASIHPKIKENDILIVQTGDIGSVGLVTAEYDGCNCHALIIASPKTDLIFPDYLTYYLRSTVGKELLLYHKTGALLPHLNSGKIKFANICVPGIQEQMEISNYLNIEVSKIDELVLKKVVLMNELESYKKALIYEYVTGKKEVPA